MSVWWNLKSNMINVWWIFRLFCRWSAHFQNHSLVHCYTRHDMFNMHIMYHLSTKQPPGGHQSSPKRKHSGGNASTSHHSRRPGWLHHWVLHEGGSRGKPPHSGAKPHGLPNMPGGLSSKRDSSMHSGMWTLFPCWMHRWMVKDQWHLPRLQKHTISVPFSFALYSCCIVVVDSWTICMLCSISRFCWFLGLILFSCSFMLDLVYSKPQFKIIQVVNKITIFYLL